MTPLWIVLCLLSATVPARAGWESTSALEAGYQGAYRFSDGETNVRRYYVDGAFRDLYEGETSRLSVNVDLRGWLGIENEFQPRALNINWSKDILSVTAGVQQIAWGETFGVYIADLVNPRDLRDPLFNELDWIRLPTASLNVQLFPGAWSLQGIFTPFARSTLLPDRRAGFRIIDSGLGADLEFTPEWGLRAGRLFDSGFDLSAFFLSHYARTPALEPILAPDGPALLPFEPRVRTLGAGFSYAAATWVFRGDTVLHFGQPVQNENLAPAVERTVSRTVLGTDAIFMDGAELGFQYHLDLWSGEQRHWVSTRAAKSLLGERLVPEAFVFAGVGNSDLWFQPRLTWYPLEGLSVALRADIVGDSSATRESGYLRLFSGEDRVLLWTAFRLGAL